MPTLASSVSSVVPRARITRLTARRSTGVKASTLAWIPENHHRIAEYFRTEFVTPRPKMHPRVGLIFVQCVPGGLRTALFTNTKGHPRLCTANTSSENPLPLSHAAASFRVEGFDPDAVVHGLTLYDASRETEFHFAFQKRDEVTLPPTATWVEPDEWAEAGWSPKRQPFVKEVHAVLAAHQLNYELPRSAAREVSFRSNKATFAREVALEARRPDLLFGLTVLHMTAGVPDLLGWLGKHRIDWIMTPDHPRAKFIRDACSLTHFMWSIFEVVNTPDNPAWFATSTKMLAEAAVWHCALFNRMCLRFERDVWQLIAIRLYNEQAMLRNMDAVSVHSM